MTGPLLTLAMLLAAIAAPAADVRAAAIAPPPPRAFSDAVGDANYLNDQGIDALPLGDSGPDTRPGSASSADLVEGWYETAYVSVPEHDADGRPIAIRRVPTALRVHLRTAAPAAPSFGPTVSTDLWVTVDGCPMIFRMRTRGPLSAEGDPPQGPELRTRSTDCPGGVATHSADVGLRFAGPVAVLDYPFAALETAGGPLLRPGAVVEPDPIGHGVQVASVHRSPNGLLLGGPLIDTAAPTAPFVIGSDVPPDVDCLQAPGHPECSGDGAPPDTGQDLHAALLGSAEPTRTAAGGSVDLSEEFVVYSFRPDARWLTFGFDVAAAGFDEPYVEIHLASRLMEDGEVSGEFVPISESFALWKLIYGPHADPHRTMSSVAQDTPYGLTLALPAEDLDRLTILLGADVERAADVGVVVAARGTAEPVIEEPFPDTFASWMEGWTAGLRKVRLVPDRWGQGVSLAARLSEQGGLTPTDVRRGVEVEDDRTRLAGLATEGTMRTSGTLVATGPALAGASLFYTAQADQDVAIEWKIPSATRRASRSTTGSAGASLFAAETDAGAGEYGFSLEVESGPERSSSLAYLQDLWALDPGSLFPGLRPVFFSDPEAAPVLLGGGESVPGPAPGMIFAGAPRDVCDTSAPWTSSSRCAALPASR